MRRNTCVDCDKEIGPKSKRCRACSMRVIQKLSPKSVKLYTGAERARRWREAHPEKNKQVRAAQRRRKKALINDAKAAMGCKRCDSADPRVLDLHHRDPGQKVMAVSQMVNKCSTQRILAEIAKCEAMCANCHRILHHEEADALPSNVVDIAAAGFFRAS